MKPSLTALLATTCLTLSPLAMSYADGVAIHNPKTYQAYLADGYSHVADMEDGDATDQIDEKVMSDRAIAVYNGNTVLPLTPDQVRLVRSTREDLAGFRERLMRVIANPNKMAMYPKAVAHAQVAYDCWALHQQTEPNASHNLYRCEANFKRLIEALDTPPEVAAAPTTLPTVVLYDVTSMNEVSFAWNSTTLSAADKATLDEIKAALTNANDPAKHIAVQGFADRSGPADYNQALSEKRAQVVAEYLGVDPADTVHVDLKAYGENNLPVPTADGVREARNRITKVAIVKEAAHE